jgi:asparagine synthetase B (glutamine-hydrolysing)
LQLDVNLNIDESEFPSPPIDPDTLPSLELLSPIHGTSYRRFFSLLSESVRSRVLSIPEHSLSSSEAPIAILFSGGLDCTVLAALAHQHLPSHLKIDLLNVAFENPRIAAARKREKKLNESDVATSIWDVPDRITGRTGYGELCATFASRTWRFVEINVPYAEAQSQSDTIRKLMNPLDTVMDLSIAMAFYFASRGHGSLLENDGYKPYASSARVLLSGLGTVQIQVH